MKNIRLWLVVGVSVLMAGCMGAAPETEEDIYFLQQRETDAPQMLALLEGELTLTEGCLRIQSGNGEGYAIIWPFDFSFNENGGGIDILNREGQVVAQVGDYISVSGGEGGSNLSQEEFERYYIGPYRCSEPYWIANFDVEVITP